MAYTYHGKSTLIALPGESHRVINGNVIVIEKDYAIRKVELPNALRDLTPGNKMPGTEYIIDVEPQFVLDDSGFARVRLSAINLDFAENDQDINTNITTQPVNLSGRHSIIDFKISFTYATGIFKYFRSKFSPSQDPIFPNSILPVVLSAQISGDPSFATIFGPSRWIGLTSAKINILENRAFQYTVTAICAPEFVQMAGEDILVRFDMTSSDGRFFDNGGQQMSFESFPKIADNIFYKLTSVQSSAVQKFKLVSDLNAQLEALNKQFAQAFAATESSGQRQLGIYYDRRIEKLKKQISQQA